MLMAIQLEFIQIYGVVIIGYNLCDMIIIKLATNMDFVKGPSLPIIT